jgi:hypothetical protein
VNGHIRASHRTKTEAGDLQRPDEGVHTVSVTPADERQSTEHGEASGAGQRGQAGVPNEAEAASTAAAGSVFGRGGNDVLRPLRGMRREALGEAGMDSDTEHDGIESVVA